MQNSSTFCFPGRIVVVALTVSLLTACASKKPIQEPPVLVHHGPVRTIDDVDVLVVTPDMQAFLDRYVLPYSDPDTRLQLLTRTIVDNAVFGFHYDEQRTLTAEEAFNARSGNCIGFANLLVAMARASGLEAEYQEILLEPVWLNERETMLVAKHINVILRGRHQAYVVDTSGLAISTNAPRKRLKDNEALALYYNNLGAEALIDSDLSLAFAYMKKAVTIAPESTDAWTNLGVVFSRNGQKAEAGQVYRQALEIDPSHFSALSNLYEIYMETGNEEEAQELERRVIRYRQRNPYQLLAMSSEAADEQDFEASIDLLERAIRKKDSEHLFHYAMARSQYLAGNEQAANDSLTRAQELAPEDLLADYSRPLAEIALED